MFKQILILSCIAFAAHAQVLCKWNADSSAATAAQFQCYRGETLELQPTLKQYGAVVSNYTATLYYQTNGMGSAWLQGTNGMFFTPAMDVGASSYSVYIQAAMSNGISYRANAIIRMLGSPGASPSTLPLPVQSIDFATVTYLNAPWILSSSWLSWLSTNTYIKVESDPGIPAAISSAVALAGTNTQSALSFKVSLTDETYTDTVAKAASALQPGLSNLTINGSAPLLKLQANGIGDNKATIQFWNGDWSTQYGGLFGYMAATYPGQNPSAGCFYRSSSTGATGVKWQLFDDGNFIAGVNYLAPTGNGSGLTNVTDASAWRNPPESVHWTWTNLVDHIEITGYDFYTNAVVIPDMLDGLPVTDFSEYVFNGTGITSISGGNNLQIARGGLFANCAALTSVTLNKTLRFGDGCFINCSSLTVVYFPLTTYIGAGCFYGCSSLWDVFIENLQGGLGGETFKGCGELRNLLAPKITSIYADDLSGCTNLDFTASNLISVVGPNFEGFPQEEFDGPAVRVINDYAFSGWTALKLVKCPQATTIGFSAFSGCTNLTSLSFPNATSINKNAFYGCPSITNVFLSQNAPPEDVGWGSVTSNRVTICVTSPTATGWTNFWNGMPVVRLPVTPSLGLATAAYVDVQKELHRDSATNVIWRSVYSNGWSWLIAYTNYPAN